MTIKNILRTSIITIAALGATYAQSDSKLDMKTAVTFTKEDVYFRLYSKLDNLPFNSALKIRYKHDIHKLTMKAQSTPIEIFDKSSYSSNMGVILRRDAKHEESPNDRIGATVNFQAKLTKKLALKGSADIYNDLDWEAKLNTLYSNFVLETKIRENGDGQTIRQSLDYYIGNKFGVGLETKIYFDEEYEGRDYFGIRLVLKN